MSVKEIKIKSKRIFYGKYTELSVMVTIFISIMLIKKVAELITAYIMLSENYITVNELFIPQDKIWRILKICFSIMEFVMLVPIVTSISRWIYSNIKSSDIKSTNFKLNFKTAVLWLTLKLINFITFFPFLFCIYSSVKYLMKAYNSSNGEAYLTISFYSLLFSLIFFGLYIYIISGMILVPFIFINNTKKNIFSVIADSFFNMNGMRKEFLKLIINFFFWGLLSVFIVTIPFVTAKFLTWYGVFAENILENKKDFNCKGSEKCEI